MDKKLLFSVSVKDCEFQTFRSGGKGGGNQNSRDTGVRLIHHPSGARGEARDTRHQHENKKQAFLRLIETKAFKVWHKLECARRYNLKSPEEVVNEEMSKIANFKIEERSEQGQWIDVTERREIEQLSRES